MTGQQLIDIIKENNAESYDVMIFTENTEKDLNAIRITVGKKDILKLGNE